jgi:Mg2+/Co2+ transporter CorB
MPLRELNRWLHLTLPTDGPKTLNGLILEILEEIPEGDVCVRIGDVKLEVMRSDDQAIRTVKIFRPGPRVGAKVKKTLRD